LLFGLYFNNDPLTARIVIGGALIMLAMSLIIWWDNKNQNYRNSVN
jgi:drug/metabolite transporter (DMT)-like permease